MVTKLEHIRAAMAEEEAWSWLECNMSLSRRYAEQIGWKLAAMAHGFFIFTRVPAHGRGEHLTFIVGRSS